MKLKPCPFCGSTSLRTRFLYGVGNHVEAVVICRRRECQARGPERGAIGQNETQAVRYARQRAHAAWNRRAKDPRPAGTKSKPRRRRSAEDVPNPHPQGGEPR